MNGRFSFDDSGPIYGEGVSFDAHANQKVGKAGAFGLPLLQG
jgi:hypothetical protein